MSYLLAFKQSLLIAVVLDRYLFPVLLFHDLLYREYMYYCHEQNLSTRLFHIGPEERHFSWTGLAAKLRFDPL